MTKQNNLLIIMSDEHQARAMGCNGHDFAKTPNLDRLAETGTRFSNAYTTSPICVPARASFATGQYVHSLRLWDNAMPYTGATPGWGHALQEQGVPVESIGKLHYRHQDDADGFDIKHVPMMVVDGVGMVWASIRREDERVIAGKRMLGDYIGPGESSYTRYDASITQRAQQWLQEKAASQEDQPWCLYVGLVAPHFPLVVPHEFYDLYPLDKLPEPKLHPNQGHVRHPWVEKQNAFMDSENQFRDNTERLMAIAAYYGLVSWMDHNVGQILKTLEESGQDKDTTIIYTSDHGDNIGARGLWGKSNLYEEAAAVPLIISNAGLESGVCDTPVTLMDVSETIVDHFHTAIGDAGPGRSLYQIAREKTQPERIAFSEYHAAGAVSGAFMVRQGRWKYIHYVGFEPELFDLEDDPEETVNLATQCRYADVVDTMRQTLYSICDPEEMDDLAHRDQAAMIEGYGGRDAALKMGAPGATPAPDDS